VCRSARSEAVTLGSTSPMGIVRLMVTGIGQIFTAKIRPRTWRADQDRQYSGEQFSLGWAEFVYFAALISINLAFINFLPIPASMVGTWLSTQRKRCAASRWAFAVRNGRCAPAWPLCWR